MSHAQEHYDSMLPPEPGIDDEIYWLNEDLIVLVRELIHLQFNRLNIEDSASEIAAIKRRIDETELAIEILTMEPDYHDN
jgi:hypothetical protein